LPLPSSPHWAPKMTADGRLADGLEGLFWLTTDGLRGVLLGGKCAQRLRSRPCFILYWQAR